ncbi:MAG: purine-nucleoside phosphorylase [Defluviitaleaceae bacterium]|nr:purine-nucleoside phosphorylase [Defluviitaleaceae bacterium]
MSKKNDLRKSVDFLQSKIGTAPEALIVLGSGLGEVAEELESKVCIPYKEIPHFGISTAPGHAGKLYAGKLNGKNVLCMQGRLHIYEGYSPEEASYPVRVASMLGASRLVLTCACGGVNIDYSVGELIMLKDYINMTHTGPLVGMDVSDFDTRFIDMSFSFDRDYITLARSEARKLGISLGTGVYFYMPGPQLETPAEIRAIRNLGGDLVGMSVVHEVIMARRLGMRVAGFALVTNMAAGILDIPLSEEEIFTEGRKAREVFGRLLAAFVGNMN